MDLDKSTLKAISAEARVKILKRLGSRRKMPSELSKEIGLAPSTIVEHLKILESAQLVQKQPAGKKWVYYSITDKGMDLMQPHTPMRLVLSAFAGLALSAFGASRILFPEGFSTSFRSAAQESAPALQQALPSAAQPQPDYLGMAAFAAGLVLVFVSVAAAYAKRRKLI